MDDKTKEGLAIVKLLVCLQTSLELLDELKETKAYRHDVKKVVNMASNTLEDYLNKVYSMFEMKGDAEDAYMEIQRCITRLVNEDVIKIIDKYGNND